ncbi:MAG: hypothetical protein GTN86_11205 [Xanthomonadales bacterium]|nr:hypothetical protein [Xanthomonadales bacterium]NIN60301.1 hypothetical protein [Xanthomonadales bacterium]NIN75653.1 hypothetical protein [Xanthomonadales bacterium]NIO14726.1 hypothetical protein [Xanthomonadales bacterium]NIP12694.1 hypothetical protein [Xanthomonadales bacterium]
MKKHLQTACLSLSIVLVGCGTQQAKPAPVSGDMATMYINAVERAAREQRVSVHWVNPPRSSSYRPRRKGKQEE